MQKTDMEKMVIERANRLASLYAKSVVDEVKQSNEYADEMLGSFSLEDLSAGLYRVYGMQMGKWNAKQPERVNEVIALLNNDPVKYKSAVILQTQRLMSAANIVPVNSSNIVDVLTTSGYGIASVGSNAKSKLQELEKTINLPVRKGGYTAFAVVEKEGKALGAMGVVNGEIDTSTCPVEEIAVQTQMIPITKIAKFLAEVIKFEDKKGISMIAVSDNVLATTGLGAIVKPNFANFMLVKDALLGVYAYLGRDVPLKTMNGEKTAGELENVLTQLYITHFKIIKNGDISAYEVTRRFEVAVSSYMALNKHPGSFEVKLNNKTQGLYFSLSLPTIALPKYILSKEYFSGASEAQAVEMKLVTTNHRGENYHKNSAGTRTMAAPFPIGKTLFEASKIRTDLELYIKLHTRIRLLLEGVEKKNDYVLHFLNALRMMGFSGTLYLDDNAKSHNAVSSVHDSTEVKYDSGVKKAKFGDAAFTVEFIHNLSSAAVPDHTGTVVYKWYGLNSTSRGKWLASYDGTRKTMNTTAYGPSFALTVFLTANELTIAEDTSQVLIASIAKHDLMGYRICNSEYEMAYAQAMKQGQAVKEKLPMLIKTERDMGNYYVESILQNVLRTQYPYTAVGYKEAYAYYEMPRQVLNLNGSVCIKPRKARVDNQDILEFAGNKARANNMIKIEGDEEIVKHNVNIVPPVLAPVVPLTVPTAVRMEPTAPSLPIPVNLNVPTVANVVPGPLHQVHVVPRPVLAPVVPGPNLTADPVPVMDDRPVRTGNPQPLRAVFDDESDD